MFSRQLAHMDNLDINDLKFAEYNPRTISKHDFSKLKQSIKKFGDLSGIVRNITTDSLVGGHQRIRAFQEMPSTIEVTQRFDQPNAVGTVAIGYVILTETGERYGYREVQWDLPFEKAANIAANRISGEFDNDMLAELIADLNTINPDLLDLVGHTDDELNKLLDMTGSLGDEGNDEHGDLTDKFIVPPFSILDTRQGYWQSRARSWGYKIGDVSATREETLGTLHKLAGDNYGGKAFAASGVSELDPVLCEVVYRWFTPHNTAHVFNPFGGEPVSAFVSAYLGYPYSGTELRAEQVDETYKKIAMLPEDKKGLVNLQVSDARHCEQVFNGVRTDLIFSSPPFYDLEVYSDKPEDLSNQGTYDEFMQGYREAFTGAVNLLNDNRFVCINVTEIRDKKGAYRNFVGDTVKLFTDLGLHFYNDIILVNAVGTAAIRAARSMNTRKVVRVHQNLLVFYKGDISNIKQHFPALEIDLPAEYDNDGTATE